MVFSSMLFIWLFLPLLLAIYFIADKKFKNIILLIFSLIFYAWGEPIYILLMIFSITLNYIFGLLIDKYKNKSIKKILLLLTIVIDIGILGYFKYFNFFIEIINSIFGRAVFNFKNIALPIGISFYTFQILSYIIDLYRNKIKVQKNILNLALYISFFPQLIAGPIVKYKDIDKEIAKRYVDITKFSYGIKRFIIGLSKKILLANTLAITADAIFDSNLELINTPIMWIGAIAYTLQIYFDFSGYSDMAIGLGSMFGFTFMENFNLPYISRSVTEFWQRWHISLSTWFKEYIYIPLGGNRVSKARNCLNIFIVFLVTGLWHGASWTFVLWGVYYGILRILEKVFLAKYLEKSKVLSHVYTIIAFIIGWVMFRANSVSNAIDMYRLMFSFDFSKTYFLTQHIVNNQFVFVLIVSILFCGPIQIIFKKLKEKNNKSTVYGYLQTILLLVLLVLCIMELASSSYNPFIYFRF